MDAKDLRVDPVLGERNDRNNSNYAHSHGGGSAHGSDRNKIFLDPGSGSSSKVDVQTVRPCAVIGPDRITSQIMPGPDSLHKKSQIEGWGYADNGYRKPPEYPHKTVEQQLPSRNISPRQTFQENMQRIMVPPRGNISKLAENSSNIADKNIIPNKNMKVNMSTDQKYYDVPYIVNPLANDQRGLSRNPEMIPNVNPALLRGPSQGWPVRGSAPIHPPRSYGVSELYRYPDYNGSRPITLGRPLRPIPEESVLPYADPYCRTGNVRYEPYPTTKERYPNPRYDYINNYPSPYPSNFPTQHTTHKYGLQKPFGYIGYPQVPLKYLEPRVSESHLDGYQRPLNQQPGFNVSYHGQNVPPNYVHNTGSSYPNKIYQYSDNSIKSTSLSKNPYENPNKFAIDYDPTQIKIYSGTDNIYLNGPMKGPLMMPNYPPVNNMPPHPHYRKENLGMKSYDHITHYKNIEQGMNIHNPYSRMPSHFSPNVISPSDSNTSNDTIYTLAMSQEDCGYVSQSSTTSGRSIDIGNKFHNYDTLKRYEYRYGIGQCGNSPTSRHDFPNKSLERKDKKNLNVRQFLQMWNEGDDEHNENNNIKESTSAMIGSNVMPKHHSTSNNQELYVLGSVNIPSEELSKYEHIQKVSKLPENIKGYNSLELLNQFEEVIESSNLNKSVTARERPELKYVPMQKISNDIMRPLSPLDVEAKISQSVIHKEVGCNFEIKPCSPKMLNVEIATSAQTILEERSIEKVTNPLVTQISKQVKNRDVKGSFKIKINDIEKVVEDIPSCKMIKTAYSAEADNNECIKSNYTIQDLESNSGVCLASLPRLDTDIELNFPEVNQQFIDANKGEPISKNSMRTSDISLSKNDIQSRKEDNIPSPITDSSFTKLSKFRKSKVNTKEINEKTTAAQGQRTNSVIIKNPENVERNLAYDSIEPLQEKEKPFAIVSHITESQLATPINLTYHHKMGNNDLPFINIEQRNESCCNNDMPGISNVDSGNNMSMNVAINLSLNSHVADANDLNEVTQHQSDVNSNTVISYIDDDNKLVPVVLTENNVDSIPTTTDEQRQNLESNNSPKYAYQITDSDIDTITNNNVTAETKRYYKNEYEVDKVNETDINYGIADKVVEDSVINNTKPSFNDLLKENSLDTDVYKEINETLQESNELNLLKLEIENELVSNTSQNYTLEENHVSYETPALHLETLIMKSEDSIVETNQENSENKKNNMTIDTQLSKTIQSISCFDHESMKHLDERKISVQDETNQSLIFIEKEIISGQLISDGDKRISLSDTGQHLSPTINKEHIPKDNNNEDENHITSKNQECCVDETTCQNITQSSDFSKVTKVSEQKKIHPEFVNVKSNTDTDKNHQCQRSSYQSLANQDFDEKHTNNITFTVSTLQELCYSKIEYINHVSDNCEKQSLSDENRCSGKDIKKGILSNMSTDNNNKKEIILDEIHHGIRDRDNQEFDQGPKDMLNVTFIDNKSNKKEHITNLVTVLPHQLIDNEKDKTIADEKQRKDCIADTALHIPPHSDVGQKEHNIMLGICTHIDKKLQHNTNTTNTVSLLAQSHSNIEFENNKISDVYCNVNNQTQSDESYSNNNNEHLILNTVSILHDNCHELEHRVPIMDLLHSNSAKVAVNKICNENVIKTNEDTYCKPSDYKDVDSNMDINNSTDKIIYESSTNGLKPTQNEFNVTIENINLNETVSNGLHIVNDFSSSNLDLNPNLVDGGPIFDGNNIKTAIKNKKLSLNKELNSPQIRNLILNEFGYYSNCENVIKPDIDNKKEKIVKVGNNEDCELQKKNINVESTDALEPIKMYEIENQNRVNSMILGSTSVESCKSVKSAEINQHDFKSNNRTFDDNLLNMDNMEINKNIYVLDSNDNDIRQEVAYSDNNCNNASPLINKSQVMKSNASYHTNDNICTETSLSDSKTNEGTNSESDYTNDCLALKFDSCNKNTIESYLPNNITKNEEIQISPKVINSTLCDSKTNEDTNYESGYTSDSFALKLDSCDKNTIESYLPNNIIENEENEMSPKAINLNTAVHNINQLNRRNLKRSLSDSTLCMYSQSAYNQNHIFHNNGIHSNLFEDSLTWSAKRKKFFTDNNYLESHEKENCIDTQNNRRNSTSTIHDGDVSFCIFLTNDCLITEGTSAESQDDNIQISIDNNCNDLSENSCELDIPKVGDNNSDISSVVYETEENNDINVWVDDVACVETVISDNVIEDSNDIFEPGILLSDDSNSPKVIATDDENGTLNINVHSAKLKNIYGNSICNDDIKIVEALYRTPQINVNDRLNEKESPIEYIHNFKEYDNKSLEMILSGVDNDEETSSKIHDNDSVASQHYSTHDDAPFEEFTAIKEHLMLDFDNKSDQCETDNRCNDIGTENYIYKNLNESQDELVYPSRHDYNSQSDSDMCRSTSSSPEVTSTTEEKKAGILLKITNYNGSRVSVVEDNSQILEFGPKRLRCKFTELTHYVTSENSKRTLITKAAKKYIPPLKNYYNLKVKLPLPQQSLLKLKELKSAKERPKNDSNSNIKICRNEINKLTIKKIKPNFEDVLKNIDEVHYKLHKVKRKNFKESIPKVVIKKNENGSHYASTSKKEYNPDMTGRKWQPWVFLEKNNFIDKMVLRHKRDAIFCQKKNMYIFKEKLPKKIHCVKTLQAFDIANPTLLNDSSKLPLKYTIRLKHDI